MRDASGLWNAVEERENWKNSQLARENVVALPHELTLEQNRDLLHGFVQEAYVRCGMAAQVNIHAPSEDGNERNVHAHVMLTMRGMTRNGWKEKKARNWNEKATLEEWRTLWADHVNRALERAGIEERVTEKSFEDLGLDKAPSKHLGPEASQMERRGQGSRIGNENRAAKDHNQKMAALAAQQEVLANAVKREAFKLAEEKRKAFEKERGLRGRNLTAEAVIAERENRTAHARRELLDRGPAFWVQVEKDFAQEQQAIRDFYNLEALKQSLAEARERVRGTDTANGRFSGEHNSALEAVTALEKNLANARERQAEALDKLEADRAYVQQERDERAAVMNDRLNAQFEAQQGGMEMPEQDAAIEQDNAGSLSAEDFEETREEGRDQGDDMELSR